MSSMKHKFRFPVGDWSGDGHGKCEWFQVRSNQPVEKWREAYFASLIKFNEHDIAPDSHHNGRKDRGWPLHKMRELVGFKFPNTDYDWQYDQQRGEKIEVIQDIPRVGFPDPKDAVGYTLAFCQASDSSLKFEIIEKETEMFQFYGFDEQERHIGHIGYEIFMDGW